VTATRAFALVGSKTLRVIATDSNGLSSPWVPYSFSCSEASGNPAGTSLPSGTTGTSTTTETTTDMGAQDQNPFTSSTDTTPGFTGLSGPPTPDLSIKAVPSLLRKGQPTHVYWSAHHVNTCTVSGTSGDFWTGLLSPI